MLRAFLLVLCLLLAGCTSDEAPEPGPGSEPNPTTAPTTGPTNPEPIVVEIPLLLGFEYADCAGLEIRGPMDVDEARTMVPEPYEVRVRAGDIDDTPYATARWRILSCPTFAVGNNVFNDTVHGDVAIEIAPHTINPLPAGDTGWYRLRVFAEDSNIADAWTASGYDVVRGTATMTTTGASPVTQRNMEFAGYAMQAFGEVGQASTGTETHHTVVDNDAVVWHDTRSGTIVRTADGSLTTPSDDPLRPWAPTQPGQATAFWYDGVTLGPSEAWLIRGS